MQKIKSCLRRCQAKIRDFYLSFIGGLLAAVPVSYLFSEITIGQVQRKVCVIVIFAVITISIYLFGILVLKLLGKKYFFPFTINFLAGFWATVFLSALIHFQEQKLLLLIIAGLMILAFPLIALSVAKIKRRGN